MMKNEKLNKQQIAVQSLGPCQYDSPLEEGTYFTDDDHSILCQQLFHQKKDSAETLNTGFLLAGPRKKLYFNSQHVNIGIVTCGGLCPGLNDVVRAITYCAKTSYKLRTVYGFRYGFAGFSEKHKDDVLVLEREYVKNIHKEGGSLLRSSRGPQDPALIVDRLVQMNISALFVIGGDGTQKGSTDIYNEVTRRKLDISIVGIPKTIDNDISYVRKTFGFDSAVEEGVKAIASAHVEAEGFLGGIGLVKLMGRHSGFIAAKASLASGDVNICLIPEEPFTMDELIEKIKFRFTTQSRHVVIAVAEGAGQHLFDSSEEIRDASGNLKFKDIGVYLKAEIRRRLMAENIQHKIIYIDPSYMIRSVPANAADSAFCLQLGNHAVHAAMAGKTNVLVGNWSDEFTLLPIPLAVSKTRHVDRNGFLWQAVREISI